MSINKWFGAGNLTRDVELRYTQGRTAVATFSIACDHSYKQGNEWKEETTFVKIVAWGKTAECCEKNLFKGAKCFVEGRLQNRSYDDKDGKKVYVTEIIAQSVEFLALKKEEKKEEKEQVVKEKTLDELFGNDDECVPF